MHWSMTESTYFIFHRCHVLYAHKYGMWSKPMIVLLKVCVGVCGGLNSVLLNGERPELAILKVVTVYCFNNKITDLRDHVMQE